MIGPKRFTDLVDSALDVEDQVVYIIATHGDGIQDQVGRFRAHLVGEQLDAVSSLGTHGGHLAGGNGPQGRHPDGPVGGGNTGQGHRGEVVDGDVAGPAQSHINGAGVGGGGESVPGAAVQRNGRYRPVTVDDRSSRRGQFHPVGCAQGRLRQIDIAPLAAGGDNDIAAVSGCTAGVDRKVGEDGAGDVALAAVPRSGGDLDQVAGGDGGGQGHVAAGLDIHVLEGGEFSLVQDHVQAGHQTQPAGVVRPAVVDLDDGPGDGDGPRGRDADLSWSGDLGPGGDGPLFCPLRDLTRHGGVAARLDGDRAGGGRHPAAHEGVVAGHDGHRPAGAHRLAVEGASGTRDAVLVDARGEGRLLLVDGLRAPPGDVHLLGDLDLGVVGLVAGPLAVDIVGLAEPHHGDLQPLVVDVVPDGGPVILVVMLGLGDVHVLVAAPVVPGVGIGHTLIKFSPYLHPVVIVWVVLAGEEVLVLVVEGIFAFHLKSEHFIQPVAGHVIRGLRPAEVILPPVVRVPLLVLVRLVRLLPEVPVDIAHDHALDLLGEKLVFDAVGDVEVPVWLFHVAAGVGIVQILVVGGALRPERGPVQGHRVGAAGAGLVAAVGQGVLPHPVPGVADLPAGRSLVVVYSGVLPFQDNDVAVVIDLDRLLEQEVRAVFTAPIPPVIAVRTHNLIFRAFKLAPDLHLVVIEHHEILV